MEHRIKVSISVKISKISAEYTIYMDYRPIAGDLISLISFLTYDQKATTDEEVLGLLQEHEIKLTSVIALGYDGETTYDCEAILDK